MLWESWSSLPEGHYQTSPFSLLLLLHFEATVNIGHWNIPVNNLVLNLGVYPLGPEGSLPVSSLSENEVH